MTVFRSPKRRLTDTQESIKRRLVHFYEQQLFCVIVTMLVLKIKIPQNVAAQ